MANNNEEETIKKPEGSGEVLFDEKEVEASVEPQESLGTSESVEDADTKEKIRQQMEALDLDEQSVAQAHSHANNLMSLETKEKIQQLLQIAKDKGVVFAVSVAKKMNDPYVLDTFHDALAKEGYYKKFNK